jgi:AcrR family transcriptional regulator
MPRTPEQLERIREESREKILGSALRLFAHHGYERTSVRMIAEDAGISRGLLYNYYGGKQDLLRAILERSGEDVRASFRRAEEGATPEERLERLVRAAFELVRRNLAFWRLTYQLRMQPGVLEALGDAVEASSAPILRRLAGILGEVGTGAAGAADPTVEARVLFAAIDGAAQHYAMDPERYPLDEVAGRLVARFLPGASGLAGEHDPGRLP